MSATSFSAQEIAAKLGISTRMFMRMFRTGDAPMPVNPRDKESNYRWTAAAVETILSPLNMKKVQTPVRPRVPKATRKLAERGELHSVPEPTKDEPQDEPRVTLALVKLRGDKIVEILNPDVMAGMSQK